MRAVLGTVGPNSRSTTSASSSSWRMVLTTRLGGPLEPDVKSDTQAVSAFMGAIAEAAPDAGSSRTLPAGIAPSVRT